MKIRRGRAYLVETLSSALVSSEIFKKQTTTKAFVSTNRNIRKRGKGREGSTCSLVWSIYFFSVAVIWSVGEDDISDFSCLYVVALCCMYNNNH